MLDFEQNYQNRRAVFRAVQASQKAESKVVDEIRRKAIAGKQELLLLLSGWLMELKPETSIPLQDRQEIQSLTNVALKDWIELQGFAQVITADLALAEKGYQEAQAKVKEYNPLSLFTAKTPKDKPAEQPDVLLKKVVSTRTKCAELKQRLRLNDLERQAFAEKVFRDLLSSLEQLSRSRALGTEITEITNRVTVDINNVWSVYQQQELQGLKEVCNAMDELRHNFSLSGQYLPEAEASDSVEGNA